MFLQLKLLHELYQPSRVQIEEYYYEDTSQLLTDIEKKVIQQIF